MLKVMLIEAEDRFYRWWDANPCKFKAIIYAIATPLGVGTILLSDYIARTLMQFASGMFLLAGH